MTTAAILLIFLVLFAVMMLVVGFGFRVFEAQRKKKVTDLLRTATGEAVATEEKILVEPSEANPRSAAALISRLPFYRHLETYISQAGLSWTPAGVLIAMGIGAAAGVLIATRIHISVFREFGMLGFAFVLGILPYAYVRRARCKRLAEFEAQFPEALDFLARSMKAGHAFSVSLETMAKESPEPLGTEFRKLFHEQNLGAPLPVALRNLAERVPLLDVRFFVSAVMLQRETGGNLAEILIKLAYIIRERFRLKGQVKAVSAHGRLTAKIVTCVPIFVIFALMAIAPDYLPALVKDPHGRYLIAFCVLGQFLGYYCMKRITNIKV